MDGVLHGNEIVHYLQNNKRHESDQGHSRKLYRVPQVTFKWKTLKQSVYFLKAVEFCPTFETQSNVTLAIFWKKLQNYIF